VGVNGRKKMRKLIVLIFLCILTQGCATKISTNDKAAQQEFRRLMNLDE
jgi:uncharacterized protein YceK